MSEGIIRVATKEDAPALLDLIQTAFKEVKEYGIEWPSTNATLEMVTENIERSVALLYEIKGELVSTITIRLPWESETPVSRYPFLWWFATANAYRGQGIGKKFLKQVENDYLIQLYKAPAYMIGTSGKKHPWLLDMYLRNGYQIHGKHLDEATQDIGVSLYKVLIPEKFERRLLNPSA